MSSLIPNTSKHFYQFLGLHSFLIGLFPFFTPVYLWRQGLELSQIFFFIALTGVGFLIALWLWDRIHKKIAFQHIAGISFVLEIALLSIIFADNSSPYLLLYGLINGAYNCFFWITQRALFFETISTENSGRKFGNFQIYVAITLKLGVLSGGLLLEYFGYFSVFLASTLIAITGMASFTLVKEKATLPKTLIEDKPLSFKAIVSFKDQYGSRSAFMLDGLFLFLESYLWIISLYLLAHESFWKLGLLVVFLAISFSALFFFIKNTIDKKPKQLVFRIAVVSYALSWVLRIIVDETLPLVALLILLVLISFGTSFFRLAFNKRFFDLAKQTSAHQYLFLKSYYSQFFIAIIYSIVGVLTLTNPDPQLLLKTTYFIAALLSAIYLLYRPHSASNATPDS